jgi:hypothetical protein
MNKLYHIYLIEYCPAFKRKKILTHATACMNIKDIRVKEISQSQKDKYGLILLTRGSYSKVIETQSTAVVSRR